jgi:hypothetical protein
MKVKIDRIESPTAPTGVHLLKDRAYGELSGAYIPADIFARVSDTSIAKLLEDHGYDESIDPKDPMKQRVIKIKREGPKVVDIDDRKLYAILNGKDIPEDEPVKKSRKEQE